MKRILLLIILLISIILFTGCFNNPNKNNNGNQEVPPLNILITNNAEIEYNISLIITNENDDNIFQENFSLNINEEKDIKNITKVKGKYFVSVELNDNRNETYPVYVSENAYYVYININKNEIEIKQTVE